MEDKDNWKITVNAQYQEAMKIILNFAIASLALPIFIVTNFINSKSEAKTAILLHSWAIWCWGGFILCIFFCLGFYYNSAKFVKAVSGGYGNEKINQEDKWVRLIKWGMRIWAKIFKNSGEVPITHESIYEGCRDMCIRAAIFCFFAGFIFAFIFF